MTTIKYYSMSVKKLFTRLIVLFVLCAFAISAKATPTIEPIVGEDKGYTITINETADFDIFNSGNNVFYTEDDGTEIKVSEIKELVIVTKAPHKLDRAKAKNLLNNCTSLDYLDLENCSVAGVENVEGDNPFLNKSDGDPNPFKNRLKTLIFPKDAGMTIPSNAFKGDTSLETVVFPDNNGTYEIMAYAFQDCFELKTVSLGKGYTIHDMAGNGGMWTAASGSGKAIFDHCKNLKNLVLDNSITDIGENAFQRCYSLEYVVLPEDLIHLGYMSFKASGLRTVTIPDHVILTGSSSNQVFQYCGQLRNIFVNADNIPAGIQSVMENNQTMNFNWALGSDADQTCSIDDYVATARCQSNYSDCPWENQPYVVPIFHYPGTLTAIENYRVPFYMHYSGNHDDTDTTWPNQTDLSKIYNGVTIDGVFYRGYSYNDDVNNTQYAGWRQFLIGNNTFKEQKVFYDERIKESRWYSICLPIDMTEAQFMNAYGVGAALNEFSGAEYDEENNMIVLKFDTPATVGSDGKLLKKGVPYMIHPAKIKFSKRKEVVIANLEGGVEFQKETNTETGQEDYVTTEVIATFDVESDLFVNWNTILAGGQAFSDREAEIIENTNTSLSENAQTRRFTNDRFPSVDYTFKGSYLGAAVWGPVTKYIGVSPKLPVGAYYLGYKEGMEKPQFFKAKGTATWSPYCALVEAANVTAGSDSGAKDFNVLDVDFNKTDVVVTKIGTPTIQIPVVNTDNKVYNLNGQVVRENAKDTNGLKGIYVVGGKKVVFN